MKTALFLCLCVLLSDSVFPIEKNEVLLKRARLFEECALYSLAREQYKHVLEKDPKDKNISKKLEAISEQEAEFFHQNALSARKAGAFPLAFSEVERSLAMDPDSKKVKKLKADLSKEIKLEEGLREQIAKDYMEGLEKYQENKLNQALVAFVKVLNMNPYHKGALTYIEKLSQKIPKEKSE
jgi:tetratricopeptide (TPR) repeat protein